MVGGIGSYAFMLLLLLLLLLLLPCAGGGLDIAIWRDS